MLNKPPLNIDLKKKETADSIKRQMFIEEEKKNRVFLFFDTTS